jgi:hypothetical protein
MTDELMDFTGAQEMNVINGVSGSDMHASEQEFGRSFAARHYLMSVLHR